jgi:hypothetical protein
MNEKELARYREIIEKVLAGKRVTDADYDEFITFMPQIDEESMSRIIQGGADKYGKEEYEAAMQSMAVSAMADPTYKQKMLDVAEKQELGRVAGNVRGILNTALASVDMAVGAKQISDARTASRKSRRPARPAPLTADPMLASQISDAQKQRFEAERTLAPQRQAILDSYLAEMSNATTASTGQAGARGAMGQVAATRRGKREMELAPVTDAIRARQEGRLDNLTQMRLGENAAIQQSMAQYYPTDVLAYQREQEAAGRMASQGAANMRGAAANMLQQSPDMIARQSLKNRMLDRANKMRAQYGDEAGQAAMDAQQSMLPINIFEDVETNWGSQDLIAPGRFTPKVNELQMQETFGYYPRIRR